MAIKEDGVFQLSTPAQLDKIDKLRELGIADLVALPQLVVVGDQSSGKSSVLEAISRRPFPRDSGLCTKFATNIIFRRTTQEKFSISILPNSDSSQERADKLRAFKKEEFSALSDDEFLKILEETTVLMGIGVIDNTDNSEKPTFSEDVLKIELHGPDCDNLSIIDIPGIFRTPTPGVTTKMDMEMVKEMVKRYIRDDRTIILAVIPANVDVATQEILTMANDVDPQGLRTLGVLTKPDLVDKGAESQVIELVEGKRNQLKLGYCIVRNRGQNELSSNYDDRFKKEKDFFNQAPWSTLEKERVGIRALKSRLQELLADVTRRELPKVRQQIDERLKEAQRKFASLGASRGSMIEQHAFLEAMATRFQKVVDHALDGYYDKDEFFDTSPNLKLATLKTDLDEQFSADVLFNGHTVPFSSTDDSDEGDGEKSQASVLDKADEGLEDFFSGEANDYITRYPGLAGYIPTDLIESRTEDCLRWIETKYKEVRTSGLMSVGPAVIPSLWRSQTKNWVCITKRYMTRIIYHIHDFIYRLLEYVCPDQLVRLNIWSWLEEKLLEEYDKAISRAEFIIEVERDDKPFTLNHYFNSNIQKCRQGRLQKALEKRQFWDNRDGRYAVAMSAVTTCALEMGNTEWAVQEIHDTLKSYYKVARKRMVDIVCRQASNHHLLEGKTSPLRVFSSKVISELTAEQLEEIAGEDNSSKRQRIELKVAIEKLTQGKKVLRI